MSTTSRVARSQRLVLYGVTWEEYTRMLLAFMYRPGHRLTYDRGTLEIMSPRYEHEMDSALLGRIVVVLTEELNLPLEAGGSTTFRRRRMQRGLEPDRCWWIVHAPQIRGKRRLNLRVDPPPDLALEVEVTHHVLNRMAIYAKLHVPEVWRLDKHGLTFHVLQPNGRYAEQTHSLSFSAFTASDLAPFLALHANHDQNEVAGQFRAFVRQRLASGGGAVAQP
jgi:Uma2 family endonuclease